MKRNSFKILVCICVALLLIIGFAYYWVKNHPTIDITINQGSAGEQLAIETPNIAISGKFGIETSAEIELKILNIVDQHEFVCYDLRENYKSSDIKLNIEKKDKQLILKYSGRAVNKDGKTVEYQNEIPCDMNINVNIKKN